MPEGAYIGDLSFHALHLFYPSRFVIDLVLLFLINLLENLAWSDQKAAAKSQKASQAGRSEAFNKYNHL